MANANSNYENCNYYNILAGIKANQLVKPTTHLVYVVASVIRDDKNEDPIVGSKVKVDRNVKDISVSTTLKWPSPADKSNRYSLVVFLLDYKYGIYECTRFYDRYPK
ncbi:28357_t:CDS:2 [Gigaspora margarita]|uniref:28357_t:CDS:1 n=1 Tax=Gigaspora margarita TaxID=4874 RepID=A0ABN7W1Y0_GIGMA|nr:28357_t:CDS:2 [Gigaspora margarita]